MATSPVVEAERCSLARLIAYQLGVDFDELVTLTFGSQKFSQDDFLRVADRVLGLLQECNQTSIPGPPRETRPTGDYSLDSPVFRAAYSLRFNSGLLRHMLHTAPGETADVMAGLIWDLFVTREYNRLLRLELQKLKAGA